MKKAEKRQRKTVLLSFDTEEFDLPREHGATITTEEGVAVSSRGMERILDVLQAAGVRATFFCTVSFARHSPAVMARIVDEGHEVASHGVNHSEPTSSDVVESKPLLESLTGREVTGYRQPRMFPVSDDDLTRGGYLYNSSLHPTFIPGRYMHFDIPRTPFVKNGIMQIPASVTPIFRLPVFWLACHVYPQWLYHALCRRILRHDNLFVTYFHPWEFVDLGERKEWRVPRLIRLHSGREMAHRLERLITMFKTEGADFITFTDYTRTEK